jgi:hypothetical protein
VLATIPTASARAFSKAIWGPVARNGVDQFPLYRQLGVSTYQITLNWSAAAPRRPHHPTDPRDPAYRWPAELQRAVTEARRYHTRVLVLLMFAPRWANGGRGPTWATVDPNSFAEFATAAARRYPSVHLWMVWGEPTRRGNFAPLPRALPGRPLNRAQARAPHLYARLLDAAYGALKQVSRRNLVIGGCTYTTGQIDTQQWIQNLRLPGGRRPRMDMYAHNPFTTQTPSFSAPASPFGEVQFSDLHRLAHWVDHYLRRGMPLFLSEWTIPTAPDNEFDFWVEPPVAAQWVADALRLSRQWKRIYALGWVHVYDDPPATTGGLLYANGSPKPGFAAFARG